MFRCHGCGASVGNTPYCDICRPKVKQIQVQVRGIMVKANMRTADGLTCVDCGKRAFHYDHRYYSRPLDVVPVCRSCNQKRGPALDIAGVIRNGIGYTPAGVPFVEYQEERPAEAPAPVGAISLDALLDNAERVSITEALKKTHWNRTKAAKLLGINFRSMRYRMNRLKIEQSD